MKFSGEMARHVEVIVHAVAAAAEEGAVRAAIADFGVAGINLDLIEQSLGVGFGRAPGRDAGFEGDVGAVFARHVNAAVGRVDAEVSGGEGEGGAAHLADVRPAPVVVFFGAVAAVPVTTGNLSGGDPMRPHVAGGNHRP